MPAVPSIATELAAKLRRRDAVRRATERRFRALSKRGHRDPRNDEPAAFEGKNYTAPALSQFSGILPASGRFASSPCLLKATKISWMGLCVDYLICIIAGAE